MISQLSEVKKNTDGLMKKVKLIDGDIMKKLATLSGDDIGGNTQFNSHEETFKALEDALSKLEQDLIDTKVRVTDDTSSALDLCKRTREDYILRMKELEKTQKELADTTLDSVTNVRSKYDQALTDLRNNG